MRKFALLFGAVAFIAAPSSAQSILTIGNSLTWDAVPAALDGDVSWHVTCNKNLQFIFSQPYSHCLGSSNPWIDAFEETTFDFVTVQPFTGTTLKKDAEIISVWMEQQPEAVFVVHAGWASASALQTTYELPNLNDRMLHSRAYFRDLLDAVSANHPDREIGYTHSLDLLYAVAQDIDAGIAPLDSLEELFRDSTHMEHQTGKYLVHNAMRHALGQPLSNEGFSIDPHLAEYFNSKIQQLADELPKLDGLLTPSHSPTPDELEPGSKLEPTVNSTVTNVPEPSALALFLLAGAGLLGRRRTRRRVSPVM